MLNKIKSKLIIKKIFCLFYERRKLEIIKINKLIKSKLNIDINNYKNYSGRYKINEENGNIKVYNGYNDELIFEGEYSKGRRNGKGKEYLNNQLVFEGEYSNGERNGKGKE